MATKHLYECEDVAASLLYGLTEGDSVLAVRAAKELYVSGETELLQRLLTLAWLLDDPDHPEQALRLKAFCSQDHETLLYLLCSSKKHALPSLPEESDAQPPSLSSASSAKEVDGWTRLPTGWSVEQANRALSAIRHALKKKYWQHAVYLASPLIRGNTYSLIALLLCLGVPKELATLLETTVYTPLAHRILIHAFASLALSLTEETLVAQPEKRLCAIWNAVDPAGKTGRILKIGSGPLSVWRLRRKSVSRLVGMPCLVAEEDATAYWRDAVATYGITLKNGELYFASDDHQENFYEKCFPEDIPDEWSVEERKKSHDIDPSIAVENPWQTAFLLCWA